MESQYVLGIVGLGNMAQAILHAVLKKKLIVPKDICIYNPHREKCKVFEELGCVIASNVTETAKAGYILLGVKPFILDSVLQEIGNLTAERCLISIAAGITTAHIAARCAATTQIVRAMPNTTLLVECGATAIAENNRIPVERFEMVCKIFECGGIVKVLPEEKMNEIIAINGSSPAFFYRFIKDMSIYAERNGIDFETALSLASKTMEGAAKMLVETQMTPDHLIAQVTTPGGTTQAALHKMDELQLDETLLEAMSACTKRAYELANS